MNDKKAIPTTVYSEPEEGKTIYDLLKKGMRGETANRFNEAICFMLNISDNETNYLLNLENIKGYRKKFDLHLVIAPEENYKEAIDIFTEILKTNPNHLLALEYRGLAKKAINNKSALKDIDKAVELSTNKPSSYLFFHRAIVVKTNIAAIENYNKAIELNPNHEKAYEYRGIIKQCILDDYSGALQDFDKAIEANPNYAAAYSSRGDIKAKLKDLPGAMEDLNKALQLDTDNWGAYLNRHLVYYKLGDTKQGDIDLKKSIDLHTAESKKHKKLKTTIDSFTQSVYDALNKSRKDETANWFNKAVCLMLGVEDDDTNYLFKLENVKGYRKKRNFNISLTTKMDYSKAVGIFSGILKTKPNHALSFEFRAIAKNILQDYKSALTDFNKAIELSTNNLNTCFIFLNRRLLWENLKDRKKAFKDYEKAIELDSTCTYPYLNRGVIKQFWQDDYEGAMNDYNKAIECNTFFASAYNVRGSLKTTLKDFSGAMEDLDMAVELDQNSTHAYKNRAVLYYKLGNFEKVMEDCNKAIEIAPDFASAYFNRGNARFQLYDFAGAVHDYEKTLQIDRYYINADKKLKIALAKLEEVCGEGDL